MFIVVSLVDKWNKVYNAPKARVLRGDSHVTKFVYKLCLDTPEVLRKKLSIVIHSFLKRF